MRKSTLNPNANEFKPRFNTQVSYNPLLPSLKHLETKNWVWYLIYSCLYMLLFFFVFSLSPNQPTPQRLPGLKASPAPPSWSSNLRLFMARQSASPRCIRWRQSALEFRWDTHLHTEMYIMEIFNFIQCKSPRASHCVGMKCRVHSDQPLTTVTNMSVYVCPHVVIFFPFLWFMPTIIIFSVYFMFLRTKLTFVVICFIVNFFPPCSRRSIRGGKKGPPPHDMLFPVFFWEGVSYMVFLQNELRNV